MELKDLKVLSVRNNKILNVPSTIRNLKALKVLNLSVNQISELPWDLLHHHLLHGSLNHFTARPNPFTEIEDSEIAIWHCSPIQANDHSSKGALYFTEDKDLSLAHALFPIHVASGPVTRLNMDGQPVDPEVHNPSKTPPTHAPSLRELALRTLVKMPGLEQVTEDDLNEFPRLLVPLFKQARAWRAEGGWICSVCQREYVHARTSWVEWWDCSPQENGMKRPRAPGEKLRPLPFRRFGCSWGCLPQS